METGRWGSSGRSLETGRAWSSDLDILSRAASRSSARTRRGWVDRRAIHLALGVLGDFGGSIDRPSHRNFYSAGKYVHPYAHFCSGVNVRLIAATPQLMPPFCSTGKQSESAHNRTRRLAGRPRKCVRSSKRPRSASEQPFHDWTFPCTHPKPVATSSFSSMRSADRLSWVPQSPYCSFLDSIPPSCMGLSTVGSDSA